jgi:hypothetical protein
MDFLEGARKFFSDNLSSIGFLFRIREGNMVFSSKSFGNVPDLHLRKRFALSDEAVSGRFGLRIVFTLSPIYQVG